MSETARTKNDTHCLPRYILALIALVALLAAALPFAAVHALLRDYRLMAECQSQGFPEWRCDGWLRGR